MTSDLDDGAAGCSNENRGEETSPLQQAFLTSKPETHGAARRLSPASSDDEGENQRKASRRDRGLVSISFSDMDFAQTLVRRLEKAGGCNSDPNFATSMPMQAPPSSPGTSPNNGPTRSPGRSPSSRSRGRAGSVSSEDENRISVRWRAPRSLLSLLEEKDSPGSGKGKYAAPPSPAIVIPSSSLGQKPLAVASQDSPTQLKRPASAPCLRGPPHTGPIPCDVVAAAHTSSRSPSKIYSRPASACVSPSAQKRAGGTRARSSPSAMLSRDGRLHVALPVGDGRITLENFLKPASDAQQAYDRLQRPGNTDFSGRQLTRQRRPLSAPGGPRCATQNKLCLASQAKPRHQCRPGSAGASASRIPIRAHNCTDGSTARRMMRPMRFESKAIQARFHR